MSRKPWFTAQCLACVLVIPDLPIKLSTLSLGVIKDLSSGSCPRVCFYTPLFLSLSFLIHPPLSYSFSLLYFMIYLSFHFHLSFSLYLTVVSLSFPLVAFQCPPAPAPPPACTSTCMTPIIEGSLPSQCPWCAFWRSSRPCRGTWAGCPGWRWRTGAEDSVRRSWACSCTPRWHWWWHRHVGGSGPTAGRKTAQPWRVHMELFTSPGSKQHRGVWV